MAWKIGWTWIHAALEPPGIRAGPSRAPASPPDTPAPILQAWGNAVSRAVKSEQVSNRFRDIGFEPVGSQPAEFRAMLARERETWQRVVAETGVRIP